MVWQISMNIELNDRKLFLDDLRNPPDYGWDVVRSYDDFVQWIELHGMPEMISFDHDLSFDHYLFNSSEHSVIPYDEYKEKTGFHCAKYIVDNNLPLRRWKVHSANTVGRENIIGLLSQYERILRGEDPRFR